MKKHVLTSLLLGTVLSTAYSQKVEWNTPGAGNPFIPGYFADPTVKKFGDTYYVYATTDGSGAGFGPSQVWCSKDFENDELAGQPLDLGPGCDEAYRWQVSYVLLSALQCI